MLCLLLAAGKSVFVPATGVHKLSGHVLGQFNGQLGVSQLAQVLGGKQLLEGSTLWVKLAAENGKSAVLDDGNKFQP